MAEITDILMDFNFLFNLKFLFFGIPHDYNSQNTVASILSDITVSIQSKEIQTCHGFGKTDRKTKSKKTDVRFINRKHCKKALLNNKKLSNINNNKALH